MACKIRSGLARSHSDRLWQRGTDDVSNRPTCRGRRYIAGVATAGDDQVDVDLTVFNPARIWRIPGTMNCKGDDVKTRPHRMAQILSAPEKFGIVTPEQMEIAASWKHTAPVVEETTSLPREISEFNLDDWILRYCPELGQPRCGKTAGSGCSRSVRSTTRTVTGPPS